ncbi:hypothetical protein [Kitasatospora sp. NPDC059571]|uniref:hypothetical protein n=1 Tax=Kitasatospora sp. NPDC059571 TaxID=3346871 RepID=UPI00368B1672
MPAPADIEALLPDRDGPAIVITADPTRPTTQHDLNEVLGALTADTHLPTRVHLILSHPATQRLLAAHPGEAPFNPAATRRLQHLADTHQIALHITEGASAPTADGTLRPMPHATQHTPHAVGLHTTPENNRPTDPTWHDFTPTRRAPEPTDHTTQTDNPPNPHPHEHEHADTPRSDPHDPVPGTTPATDSTTPRHTETHAGEHPAASRHVETYNPHKAQGASLSAEIEHALNPLRPGEFPSAAADGGPSSGPQPVEVHPAALSMGIPKAQLPAVSLVVGHLRAQAEREGVRVEDNVWDALPQRLLSNYPYLVGDGLVVELGGAEALVGLRPTASEKVGNPGASFDVPVAAERDGQGGADKGRFYSNQATQGIFQIGAHSQTQTGQAGAFRAKISPTVGLGLAPGVVQVVKGGLTVGGTANESGRTTSHLKDAEAGRVEDTRGASTLIAFAPGWRIKFRTDAAQSWADTNGTVIPDRHGEKLLLWVPDHYLGAAGRQVTVSSPHDPLDPWAETLRGNRVRIPDTFFASGLTGLPELFDGILGRLAEADVAAPIGGPLRDELMRKLWNLDVHLVDAVNDRGGYRFTLHEDGHVVAAVTVHTMRVDDISRVGATSDIAHIEKVRTAIVGQSGSQTIRNESDLQAVVEVDLLPVPFLSLGPSLNVASLGWINAAGVGGGRAGLWVMVSRYSGFTSAYQVGLRHYATVSVYTRPDQKPARTQPVAGRALLRLPEPDAFAHGFPVDVAALKRPTAGGVVGYQPDAVRNTGWRPEDPSGLVLPQHVLAGRGIGQGLAKVDRGVVTELLAHAVPELQRTGFLPADLDRLFLHTKWDGSARTDSLSDNLELVHKMISGDAIDSHYDQIHQDGLSFTLRRRGAGSVGSARVTVRAVHGASDALDREGNSVHFVRRTGEYHLVNLAMGMGFAGQSAAGGRKLAVGPRFNAGSKEVPWLKVLNATLEYQRSIGATDSVDFMSNRPELLEYPGDVDEFRIPSFYTVEIAYDDGTPPLLMPSPRLDTIEADATVHLIPGLNTRPSQATAGQPPTPREVIDEAVVYYLDSTGVLPAARRLLPVLTGPGAASDEEVANFASTISVRAHLKEILYNEYATDQLFEAGYVRDRYGALAVSGTMGPSAFAGATPDKFVLGLIKLGLATATQSESKSSGVFATATVGVGGTTGAEELSGIVGQAGGNRRWGWNKGRSLGRTGGRELLELDFHRAYAFTTTVDFEVRGAQERRSKLWPDSVSGPLPVEVPGRRMVYLLAEPEALARYGEGKLPIDDAQLVDALTRWDAEELRLPGTVVAQTLSRWARETAPHGPAVPDSLPARQSGWAGRLRDLHEAGGLPVIDAQARQRFTDAFALDLADPANPYQDFWMAGYLTQPGQKSFGHSGIHKLTFDGGKSAFDLVHEAVQEAAPGLLGRLPQDRRDSPPQVWWKLQRQGETVVGRIQGGLDLLQGLFSGGREQPISEDLLSAEGLSLYLVNPIGWAVSDVVEVNLRLDLTSTPVIDEFVPETGLENYGHAYNTSSATTSRDKTFGLSAKLGLSGAPGVSGGPTVSAGAGYHRATTLAEVGTTEQTVYDWSGHYRARLRHRLTIEVRRLETANRPVNSQLASWYRTLSGHDQPVRHVHDGDLVLKIPRGIAETRPLQQAAPIPDLSPIPALPGDAYVTAAMFDDALPVARKLLADMFGPKADHPAFRSNLSLSVLLSRGHLTNHLYEAIGGRRYKLAENLFLPGHSSDRASLWLTGDLFDLTVIAPIVDATGTGRYTKHQSGTTSASTTDRLRGTLAGGVDFSGQVVLDNGHPDAPLATVSPDGYTDASRMAPRGQTSAGTQNYRREQHVKQQGPVYLVRLRGRFRLEAERFHHPLFGKPKSTGSFVSGPITGDVFAEIFAGEVETLRSQVRERNRTATAFDDPADWPRIGEDVPGFSLEEQLASAARNGADAFNSAHHVARQIGRQLHDPGPIRLFAHEADRIHRQFAVVLDWGIEHLAVSHPVPADLLDWHAQHTKSARLPAQLDRPADLADMESKISDIIDRVDRGRSGGLAARPPLHTVLGADPEHTARLIAYDLGRHVHLSVTDRTGTVAEYRIDPTGRVFRLNGHGSVERVEDAVARLPRELRDAIDRVGLTETELNDLYLNSWTRQEDFEHAVARAVRA